MKPTLDQFFSPYESRLGGGPSDIRELLAIADLCFRIGYAIGVAAGHRLSVNPVRVQPAPGMGAMLGVLRGIAKWPPQGAASHPANRIRLMVADLIGASESFRHGAHSSMKGLRDHLSHGHALPTDDAEAQQTRDALFGAVERMKEVLYKGLELADVTVQDGRPLLSFRGWSGSIDLSPMWAPAGSGGNEVGVFSHATTGALSYLIPGKSVVNQFGDEVVGAFFRDYAVNRAGDQTLSRFVLDVVKDVSGFTEDYSPPSYYFGDDDQAPGTVFVPWTRSTSDENVERLDVFRVGPDQQRQWRSSTESAWRPYSDFLREISNWRLLARRMRLGLLQFAKQRADEEANRLGFAVQEGPRLPQRLLEVDEELETGSDSERSLDLVNAVDQAVEAHRQTTKVFFVVGTAGTGKTRLLVDVAIQRAKDLEEGTNDGRPLYLFVSSTGRALSSLEDAVNSALNITKLLSSQGARALCRNGLLVLVVDGFDELLGGTGYENALGSLEPWFRELGGRGVIIASARSSYYLAQYRRSLSETTGVAVDHTRAALQPLELEDCKQYLRASGVPSSVLNRFQRRDWELLRLPFFAKAFIASYKEQASVQASIVDIVVERFLTRESLKLADPNQGPLMSPPELRETFALLAEQMQRQGARELELRDLTTCAEIALGVDSVEVRPGLSKRLSSLCGLGLGPDKKGSRFQFSHEILFDCFLAIGLEQAVSRENLSEFRLLLEKGRVHAAALDWIAERRPVEVARAVNELVSAPETGAPGIFGENLGALWESLLRARLGVPPTRTASGIKLRDVRLAKSGWDVVDFRDCTFDVLQLVSGSGRVSLLRCSVGSLLADSEATLKQRISKLESTDIQSVHAGEGFFDTPRSVQGLLERLGLAQRKPGEELSEAEEAAVFFLEKITARIDVPIIAFNSSRQTDDDKLKWTRKLGADAWWRFVSALERHDLISWEGIRAGGPAKSRLEFLVAPAAILRRDRVPGVDSFWTELAAR